MAMMPDDPETFTAGCILRFPAKLFFKETGTGCPRRTENGTELYHYAIFIGNGEIVHFDTAEKVILTKISDFSALKAIVDNPGRIGTPRSPEEVVLFARSEIDEEYEYSFAHQHCKWFAEKCYYNLTYN